MPLQPPPTCAELRAAYETLAVRDQNLARMGFAQAMAHTTWPRVIDCKARATRAQQQRRTSPQWAHVHRFNPATGQFVSQRICTGADQANPSLDLGA